MSHRLGQSFPAPVTLPDAAEGQGWLWEKQKVRPRNQRSPDAAVMETTGAPTGVRQELNVHEPPAPKSTCRRLILMQRRLPVRLLGGNKVPGWGPGKGDECPVRKGPGSSPSLLLPGGASANDDASANDAACNLE